MIIRLAENLIEGVVKYLICLCAALFLVAACSLSPEATSTASSAIVTQNLESVIEHSYNLLVERGFESGKLSYDTADYAIVQFPSGEQGVLVTLGFFGIARGYQLLYRIENEQPELIEPIRTGRYIWGLKSIQNERRDSAQVDMGFLELLASKDSKWKNIVRVTGAGHAGTGLWDDGYFEILAVTESGLQKLFTGVEFVTNSTTVDSTQQYQFTDLDDDGNQEIVETTEICEYGLSETGEREDLGCQQSQGIYRFNGSHYEPE